MYEMILVVVNNGSGFEGLKDDIIFWNIFIGIIMLFFCYILIIL